MAVHETESHQRIEGAGLGGGGVKMISTTATGCLVPTDQLSDALFKAFGFDIGDQKLDRQ